jgi:hypothetical protein
MKRKLVIALGCLALVFAVLVLLDWRSSRTGVTALSTKDFKEIQQVIRRSMWQQVFPDFSVQTIMASPGPLYSLVFSHIEQVDVYEEVYEEHHYARSVIVHVQTPAGLHFYEMALHFYTNGQPSWRIIYQPRDTQMFRDGLSSGGYTVVPVKHGYGLVAGSPRPGYVFPALGRNFGEKQELVLGQERFMAGLSNRTRLTLKR